MDKIEYRTWAEIDLDKLQRNLQRLRGVLGPDHKIMEVLKADAYGHGLRMCSRYAAPLVDWFAVATLPEGLVAREEAPQTPILIFGALLDHEVVEAAESRLTINVFSVEYARHVAALVEKEGLTIDVHIKVDTGMNRLGLTARVGHTDEAVAQAEEILRMKALHVTGIYTHFACADTDDPSDEAFSRDQFQAYIDVCNTLKEKGWDIGLRHCASTGGLQCYPEFRMDMVRVGMWALGQNIGEKATLQYGLEPIMQWYSRIIDIRPVAEGDTVSYARTYKTDRASRMAVVSVGYADGYSRAYSNKTHAIIRGKKVPLRGRICMDFLFADVTDLPEASVGDPVMLLGKNGDQWISPDSLLEYIAGNTNGGVTAEINFRVPRVYVSNGQVVDVTKVSYDLEYGSQTEKEDAQLA